MPAWRSSPLLSGSRPVVAEKVADATGTLDRLPPQRIDAEQAVLGSVLIDPSAIVVVAGILRPDDFYRAQNAKVFAAALSLATRREPVDLVTLSGELERSGELDFVGGSAYLTSLINLTPTAVNAEHYAGLVEEAARRRALIAAASSIAGLAYDQSRDVDEAVERAEEIVFAVSDRRTSAAFRLLRDLLGEAYERLDYLYQHRGEVVGIRTGFPALDVLTSGLQKSDLIILAARPSVGKTSLALNVAEFAAAQDNRTVAIFSLEMSHEQLVERLISSAGAIDSQRIRTGHLEAADFTRLAPTMNDLAEARIWIDDSPNLSPSDIRSKARRLEAETGLDLVIVDYLQLMRSPSRGRDANRVQEVSDISMSLKALARELRVPVLALSQLSRSVEQRQDGQPRLSDLRESGALEQDADLVMFLWKERDDNAVVHLDIAKHRNGPTGTVDLWFKRERTRFLPVDNLRSYP